MVSLEGHSLGNLYAWSRSPENSFDSRLNFVAPPPLHALYSRPLTGPGGPSHCALVSGLVGRKSEHATQSPTLSLGARRPRACIALETKWRRAIEKVKLSLRPLEATCSQRNGAGCANKSRIKMSPPLHVPMTSPMSIERATSLPRYFSVSKGQRRPRIGASGEGVGRLPPAALLHSRHGIVRHGRASAPAPDRPPFARRSLARRPMPWHDF